MLTYFIRQYRKFAFVNISSKLCHQKTLLLLTSCQDHSGRFQFSKILLFDWNFRFYHWQVMLTAWLNLLGWLCSCVRKYLPNAPVWKIPFICQCFKEKCSSRSLLGHAAMQMTTQEVFTRQLWCFTAQMLSNSPDFLY